jgi:hypothetical protein
MCGALLASVACAGPSRERETVASARSSSEPRASQGASHKAAEVRDPLQLVANGGADRPKSSAAVADAPDRGARQEKHVAVQGIEGTLSNFDVRVTLEKRGKAFAKCHEPRARMVPALAGAVEFKIHVLRSGEVSDVFVRVSDLGDRVLERCLSEVIQAARFPAPHGGEADVTWNMLLEPVQKGRAPEQWETAHVERVLRKHQSELLETCDAERGGAITVTAYVSDSGRVLAAGVAATKESSPEQFDCIAEELRSWPMPKARKGVAKVSFALGSGA